MRPLPKNVETACCRPAHAHARACACACALVGLAAVLPARAEEPAPPKKFEGAVGLILSYSPEYAGAVRNSMGLLPAGFVRYGRITVSGAGGFTTRRSDDVERGIAASLVERKNLHLSLAARFDNGRSESKSDRLAGMGDIDPTVRARLLVRWTPAPAWSLTSSVSVDALSKGGGWWGEFGASRTWQLTPVTKLQLGGHLAYAGDSYMQTWYGVTAAQAARSGYAAYKPAEGVRDVGLGITLRTELGPRWGTFVNAAATRQLGPAAASPLVEQATGWSLSSGLVWRF